MKEGRKIAQWKIVLTFHFQLLIEESGTCHDSPRIKMYTLYYKSFIFSPTEFALETDYKFTQRWLEETE